jgi:pimeloyl-ACP methyl ester carboxylesterase
MSRHRQTTRPTSRHLWHRAPWRRIAAGLVIAVALTVTAVAGFAWYVTSRLIAVVHVQDTYPLRILAYGKRQSTVTLSAGPDAAEPGTFRLAWVGGHATAGRVTRIGTRFVTRRLGHISGHLVIGQQVGIEPDPYTGNPMTALGIAYETVRVPTPLGGMPAWKIDGHRSTWVILIHGLGGSRADTLPAMPDLRALGFPMLAITYRNDVGAPASPDHQSHFGVTEWRDVAAAIRYALSNGATGVVLFGYSLGGEMALLTVEESHLANRVRALVLDSPVLNLQATLTYQGRRLGVPMPLISICEALLARRAGLNYSRLDQLRQEASLHVPVLLIQGTADTIVPPGLATAFARARPGLVTYLRVQGADHVSAIDTDPRGYRAALTRFLARLA